MPSSVELICVPPDRVQEFWPHARGLIKSAIDHTGLSDFSETERQVLAGDQFLWLAWSGSIEAAATTQLIKANGKLVLVVTGCSGAQRERWLPLFEKIETYAKDEGCKTVRIYGRPGWERVLNGYRKEYVILEKAL